jgi:hypothetical protein
MHVWIFGCCYDKMHLKYFFCTSLDSNWILKYYLKHEQQCFIRYKDTRRSRVSLGLIKHALHANVLNCFRNDRSSKFIGEVIFKKYVEKIEVKVYVNQGKSLSHIKIRHAYDFSLCLPINSLINAFLKKKTKTLFIEKSFKSCQRAYSFILRTCSRG